MASALYHARKAPACVHQVPGGTATHPKTGVSWLCHYCRQEQLRKKNSGNKQ